MQFPKVNTRYRKTQLTSINLGQDLLQRHKTYVKLHAASQGYDFVRKIPLSLILQHNRTLEHYIECLTISIFPDKTRARTSLQKHVNPLS
jgi:hypothetical protein